MRKWVIILLVLSLPSHGMTASTELPEWEATEDLAAFTLGGGLWPSGSVAAGQAALLVRRDGVPIPEEGAELAATAEGTPPVAGAEAVSEANPAQPGEPVFYGPEGAVAATVLAALTPGENDDAVAAEQDNPELVAAPEIIEELPPLTGELGKRFFAHTPVDFLIDPQHLLTEQKSNDIQRFLEFHSDEAEFDIFVMVLGEKQKIPDDVDLKALHEKWFGDQPAMLMVYYREHPDLTQLVVNADIASALPATVMAQVRENILREGSATDHAPDQVEKMAIELSIQLYWVGRLLEQESKEGLELAAAGSAREMSASADAPEVLREYAPQFFLSDPVKAVPYLFLAVLFVIAFAGGAMLWAAWRWWRDRERFGGRALLFPHFQITPRLGGEFSGGAFVGMSFDLR
jgi:hypothetical protein